jgi:spore coat protein JB
LNTDNAGNAEAGKECALTDGSLPGKCGALAFPYIAAQSNSPAMYDRGEAIRYGTLFPGLNLPFFRQIKANYAVENTALAELMALDFAVDELGLYLTTHPDDKEVLDMFYSYSELLRQGRDKYEKMYGPLFQTDYSENGYAWLSNPWPWDAEGADE